MDLFHSRYAAAILRTGAVVQQRESEASRTRTTHYSRRQSPLRSSEIRAQMCIQLLRGSCSARPITELPSGLCTQRRFLTSRQTMESCRTLTVWIISTSCSNVAPHPEEQPC